MKNKLATITAFEKKAFWALLLAVAALCLLYVYFVSSSIMNVVLREEIQQEIALVNSDIGSLESEYLAKKNEITFAYAQDLGFVAVEEKKFVARRTLLGRGLTLNDEN